MEYTLEKVFFALLRSSITGDFLAEEDKKEVPAMLPSLFKLAKRHDVTHLLAVALEYNRILANDSDIGKRFLQTRRMAVYRYEQMQYESEQIYQCLQAAKIPFIPLKGAVVRRYYKEPWMRTSCDIDILVKEADWSKAVDTVVDKLGYSKATAETDHDISLFAANGVHVEFHYTIAEEGVPAEVYNLLCRVWEFVRPSQSYQKELTDEMFYFYHIAHMAKHFKIGGCGVRYFLDISFLKESGLYDGQECRAILEQGGLLTFATAVEKCAEIWFKRSEETKISSDISKYILFAGMYADSENRAAIQQAEKGGKCGYLFSRIFLPYRQLAKQYPRLEGKKWLLPIYQVKRWFRLLFGESSKSASQEWRATFSVDEDKRKLVGELLHDLEL